MKSTEFSIFQWLFRWAKMRWLYIRHKQHTFGIGIGEWCHTYTMTMYSMLWDWKILNWHHKPKYCDYKLTYTNMNKRIARTHLQASHIRIERYTKHHRVANLFQYTDRLLYSASYSQFNAIHIQMRGVCCFVCHYVRIFDTISM